MEDSKGVGVGPHTGTNKGTAAGKTTELTISVFAAYELFPDYGAWAPTVLAILFLVHWLRTGGWKYSRQSRRHAISIFKRYHEWWLPALAVGILLVAWTFVAAGKLQTAFGRTDYLYTSSHLDITDIALAEEKYPLSRTAPADRRTLEEVELGAWKHWMASGVPGGNLYCVSSKEFADDYTDMTATFRIDSEYGIASSVAFLEYHEKAFANDPNYRSRWRQMKTRVLKGGNAVDIDIEQPERHESLLLFVQIRPAEGLGSPVDQNKCFIFDKLEVR